MARTYQQHPSYTLETSLGNVTIKPMSADYIFMDITWESPVTINRIPYRGSARFNRTDGEWNWSLNSQGRSSRYESVYLRRATSFSTDGPSDSALNKFEAVMIPAIRAWAAAHEAELIEAQRRELNNDLYSLEDKIEKHRKELEDMLAKAAALEEELHALN